MHQRNASDLLLHDTLAIPAPSPRLLADWAREVADLGLQHGDVEPLPLARTIMRWPDYPRCSAAVSGWLQSRGLPDLLDSDDLALMACLGTPYHHDAALYGDRVFCNLFLSEDKGMDLHFPALRTRIPLRRGTVVIFDTAQPHAVIPRDNEGFNVAEFAPAPDCVQVFLTWELPVANAHLQRALHIEVNVGMPGATSLIRPGACLGRDPVAVCASTGRWLRAVTDATSTGDRCL